MLNNINNFYVIIFMIGVALYLYNRENFSWWSPVPSTSQLINLPRPPTNMFPNPFPNIPRPPKNPFPNIFTNLPRPPKK